MKKNIFITGASSGVGLATAQLLTKQGHTVVGTTSNITRFYKNNSEPLSFQLIECDLASRDSIENCINSPQCNLKSIDVLILNAGIGEVGSVEDTPIEASRRLFEINYLGHVELVHAIIPYMRKRGSGTIIGLGSLVSTLAFPFKAQYCASKSALTSFLLALDLEVEPYGISTHILEPGWIRSNFHERLSPIINHKTPYHHLFQPFLDHKKDLDSRLPDGNTIASYIQKIISGNLKKTRITVGKDAFWVSIATRMLGSQLSKAVLKWYLKAKS